MDETDFVGVQADASVGVGTGCPVFQVTLDDTPGVAELAADLVMAPRI